MLPDGRLPLETETQLTDRERTRTLLSFSQEISRFSSFLVLLCLVVYFLVTRDSLVLSSVLDH